MAGRKRYDSDPSVAAVPDAVHARQLLYFEELVRELGGDAHALAERIDADAAKILADATAGYGQIAPLLEAAAAELGCADFGMRLAHRQGASRMFGPAGHAMRQAATFREAIDFISSHSYAHSLAAVIWTRHFPGSSQFAIGHTLLVDGPLIRAQAMEQIFMLGHLLALELTGGHARPRMVMFRHQPVSPIRTYRRYFDCEVLFGQSVDVVVYHDSNLDVPILASDPVSYRGALFEIERRRPAKDPFLLARARVIISHFLSTEFCTRTFVAGRLKLHPRTMDRRFVAEGTSFLGLRAEVRRDLLRYYVEETDFDFAGISERLGFSEQSVMARSCRKWFALSPTQLRGRAAGPLAARPHHRARHFSANGPPDLIFGPMRR